MEPGAVNGWFPWWDLVAGVYAVDNSWGQSIYMLATRVYAVDPFCGQLIHMLECLSSQRYRLHGFSPGPSDPPSSELDTRSSFVPLTTAAVAVIVRL